MVFSAFTNLVAKERLRTTDLIAFGLVMAAVVVSMAGRSGPAMP